MSHCWGGVAFNSLTKANFSSFREIIPVSTLSKTFQNAIYIARYIGIEYIWIDSLCIIQDDLEDWRRESSLMATVYGGSHINLAASGASNGNVGCFFKRQASWRCQVEATIRYGG